MDLGMGPEKVGRVEYRLGNIGLVKKKSGGTGGWTHKWTRDQFNSRTKESQTRKKK